MKGFLDKSSSLNEDYTKWEEYKNHSKSSDDYFCYRVQLHPENYFFFGTGYGDKDADNIQKTERAIDWTSGVPTMNVEEERVLIPATSVKGAISHRTAFHFNELQKNVFIHEAGANNLATSIDAENALSEYDFSVDWSKVNFDSKSDEWSLLKESVNNLKFSDYLQESEQWKEFKNDLEEEVSEKEESHLPVSVNNEAVRVLFGYAKGDEDGARGNVIFSDVYRNLKEEKTFNHVAIDRFTGGGIDGALFQEKAVRTDGFSIKFFVAKHAFTNEKVKQAFEKALTDLTTGELQLGGNTAKGHGAFKGSFKIV